MFEVAMWLGDRWFTVTYPRSHAHAVAFQRWLEYSVGRPACVRAVL